MSSDTRVEPRQPGGVNYLCDPAAYQEFETAYLAVRQKEGRLYPDEVVGRLPDVPPEHPLHREWQIRKSSLLRLKRLLSDLTGFHPITRYDPGSFLQRIRRRWVDGNRSPFPWIVIRRLREMRLS
jgi:hypothetical protein